MASRLTERFGRPVVMIAANDTIAQGSARSIPGFNMVEALTHCREHLIGFGGHRMAGGLKIHVDKIPAFIESFCRYAGQNLTAPQLAPRLRLDGQVRLDQLSEPVVRQLLDLGPFGQGNPRPVFATGEVSLVSEPRVVGRGEAHLQLNVSDGSVAMKGIAFNAADKMDPLADHRRCRLAFEPILNEFNGRCGVEMQVVDFQFPS